MMLDLLIILLLSAIATGTLVLESEDGAEAQIFLNKDNQIEVTQPFSTVSSFAVIANGTDLLEAISSLQGIIDSQNEIITAQQIAIDDQNQVIAAQQALVDEATGKMNEIYEVTTQDNGWFLRDVNCTSISECRCYPNPCNVGFACWDTGVDYTCGVKHFPSSRIHDTFYGLSFESVQMVHPTDNGIVLSRLDPRMGYAVTLSDDGMMMATSTEASSTHDYGGSIFIYVKDAGTGAWSFGSHYEFEDEWSYSPCDSSLEFSGDNTRLICSHVSRSPSSKGLNPNVGAMYVFDVDGAGIISERVLWPVGGAHNSQFGAVCTISRDGVLVFCTEAGGWGSFRVYEDGGADWSEIQHVETYSDNDHLDGNMRMRNIRVTHDSLRVLTLRATGVDFTGFWVVEQHVLTDGEYIFDKTVADSRWTSSQEVMYDYDGYNPQSMHCSVDCEWLVIGDTTPIVATGQLYILHFNDLTGVYDMTEQLSYEFKIQWDNFGQRVRITPDGRSLFVSQPQDDIDGYTSVGSVIHYQRETTDSAWVQMNLLSYPDKGTHEYEQFGYRLDIDLNGETLVVGSYMYDSYAGFAEIYNGVQP